MGSGTWTGSPYRDEPHTKAERRNRSPWWRLVRKLKMHSALWYAKMIDSLVMLVMLGGFGALVFSLSYCRDGRNARAVDAAAERLQYEKDVSKMRSELFFKIGNNDNCQDVVLKNSEINHGHRCPHVQHSLTQGNSDYLICSCRKTSDE